MPGYNDIWNSWSPRATGMMDGAYQLAVIEWPSNGVSWAYTARLGVQDGDDTLNYTDPSVAWTTQSSRMFLPASAMDTTTTLGSR